MAADWARGHGSVASQLDLAGENAPRAAFIHHEQDKIRSLSTDLKAKAAALEGHHRGSAPRSSEIVALAAGHSAPPVASANDECGLQDGGKNNDAICLVEQVLRNVVRNVENHFQDRATISQSVVVFGLARCARHVSDEWQDSQNNGA